MAGYVNTIEIIIINIHTDRPICGAERDKFFIDKRSLFVIVTPHHDLSGRNSVVECHLAKVDVDGSNPFARSIFFPNGGIAKWQGSGLQNRYSPVQIRVPPPDR
jgi:hypothetical protein